MRRTWTWTFDLPPAQLWPVLADTNRLNEAMGVPPYTLEETPQPDGTILRRGRVKIAGFPLEWEEKPFEWVTGRHFRQSRVFCRGPFRRLGPVVHVKPDGDGGSCVTYAFDWEPASLVGRVLGARLVSRAGDALGKRIVEAVSFARGDNTDERLTPFVLPPPPLPHGARERAATLAREVDRSPYGNGLGAKLADFVLSGMASDLGHVRPKVLARDLGVPERAATEACLASVKVGLLSMKWDLLCTNCRGPKVSVSTLSELPRGAHCPSCNIDFERDFERNVEISFAPASAVRPLPQGGFCLSSPMATKHVAVQILLRPGESRTVAVDLPAGSYRLRTLHPGAFADLEYQTGPFPGVRIMATGVEPLHVADHINEPGSITFINDAGIELAVLIEDRTWSRDTLTAPEVISLQAFRDLFAEATLRPGDDAGISQVALLFTDLRGSTALYERVGDATAYNLVREHFALLATIVREHDGAVVKTIGDAVMATFDSADRGMAAVLRMRGAMRRLNADHGREDLLLKIGMHEGPCLAVTQNERQDYFGQTVNIASRVQGLATGFSIFATGPVVQHAEAAKLLATGSAVPIPRDHTLHGILSPVTVYEIP